MPTPLIKFEVRLPLYMGPDGNGQLSNQDRATTAFLASVAILTDFEQTNAYIQHADQSVTQYNKVTGFITNAQSITALGFLATLNTALGFTVFCNSYAVTSQP